MIKKQLAEQEDGFENMQPWDPSWAPLDEVRGREVVHTADRDIAARSMVAGGGVEPCGVWGSREHS